MRKGVRWEGSERLARPRWIPTRRTRNLVPRSRCDDAGMACVQNGPRRPPSASAGIQGPALPHDLALRRPFDSSSSQIAGRRRPIDSSTYQERRTTIVRSRPAADLPQHDQGPRSGFFLLLDTTHRPLCHPITARARLRYVLMPDGRTCLAIGSRASYHQ